MSFSTLYRALQPYLPHITQHPFNKALLNGSLPSSTFNRFIQQDKYYLTHYKDALTTIAHRLSPTHDNDALKFHAFANAIKNTELRMHRHYLIEGQHTRLFNTPFIEPSTAIASYIQHLSETATSQPIPVAIASVLPCYVIYRELGLNMPYHPEHRYHRWIATYSSPSFLSMTNDMIAIFNAHSHALDHHDQNAATMSFIQSVQHELHFWDSVTLAHAPSNNQQIVN